MPCRGPSDGSPQCDTRARAGWRLGAPGPIIRRRRAAVAPRAAPVRGDAAGTASGVSSGSHTPPALIIMGRTRALHGDPEAEAAEPARPDLLRKRRWGRPGHARPACWRSRPGQADPRRYRAGRFVTALPPGPEPGVCSRSGRRLRPSQPPSAWSSGSVSLPFPPWI